MQRSDRFCFFFILASDKRIYTLTACRFLRLLNIRTHNNRVLIGRVGRVLRYEKHRFHVIGLLVQHVDQHRVHASHGGHVGQDQFVVENPPERASEVYKNVSVTQTSGRKTININYTIIDRAIITIIFLYSF